tara:strand:- start:109 stop:399 length:291 start_codon:yes stop_codon:yes gene_type:complete
MKSGSGEDPHSIPTTTSIIIIIELAGIFLEFGGRGPNESTAPSAPQRYLFMIPPISQVYMMIMRGERHCIRGRPQDHEDVQNVTSIIPEVDNPRGQ